MDILRANFSDHNWLKKKLKQKLKAKQSKNGAIKLFRRFLCETRRRWSWQGKWKRQNWSNQLFNIFRLKLFWRISKWMLSALKTCTRLLCTMGNSMTQSLYWDTFTRHLLRSKTKKPPQEKVRLIIKQRELRELKPLTRQVNKPLSQQLQISSLSQSSRKLTRRKLKD